MAARLSWHVCDCIEVSSLYPPVKAKIWLAVTTCRMACLFEHEIALQPGMICIATMPRPLRQGDVTRTKRLQLQESSK